MIKKCHAEREQWDLELISKACDYVRSKLSVCAWDRNVHTHTFTLKCIFLFFHRQTWLTQFPSDLHQSVTNTTQFNLFRPSSVLLSCLRRLTLTLKRTVSTICRQRHNPSAQTQPSCQYIGLVFFIFRLEWLLLLFSEAWFNCFLFFSSSSLHVLVRLCIRQFLLLPLAPWTSLFAVVELIWTHMHWAELSSRLLSRQTASWLQHRQTNSRPTHQAEERSNTNRSSLSLFLYYTVEMTALSGTTATVCLCVHTNSFSCYFSFLIVCLLMWLGLSLYYWRVDVYEWVCGWVYTSVLIVSNSLTKL